MMKLPENFDISRLIKKGGHKIGDDPEFIALLEKYDIVAIQGWVIESPNIEGENMHAITGIEPIGLSKIPNELSDALIQGARDAVEKHGIEIIEKPEKEGFNFDRTFPW